MRTRRDGRPRSSGGRMAGAALVALLLSVLLAIVPAQPGAAQTVGRSWVFTGGGWGHGVGVSQWGARAMAARGVTHPQILGHYYQGATVSSLTALDGIRVLLADTSQPVVLTPTGALTFSVGAEQVASFTGAAPIQVRRVAEGFELTSPAGENPQVVPGDAATVLRASWAGLAPVRVSATNQRYRYGTLAIRWRNATAQRVVLEGLTMQQYLYGLAEVPASWPAEALRTQVIAARTYAQEVAARRRVSGEQFDLFATAQDQVYAGYEHDAAVGVQPWLDAVDATADRFVSYGGAPIKAFYHASSGGYTENSEYVFVTALPYLKGVADPDDGVGNSLGSWQRTYNEDQMAAWLGAATDTSVGTLRSIRVLGPTGVSGRLDKALIELSGTAGTKVVTGSRLNQVINAGSGQTFSTQLLSTKWTVAAQDVPKPIGSLDAVRRVPGGLQASGWAFDPMAPGPILVRITVDGAGVAQGAADDPRPDVGAAYPAAGPDHGFDLHVPVAAGPHRVCAEGWGLGGITVLRCLNVVVSSSPRAHLDAARMAPGGIAVAGWAFDRDTTDPIPVHAYVDSRFAGGALADRVRGDVAAAFPGYGDRHGFAFTVPVAPGDRNLCLYAIDATANAPNYSLGCVSAARPTAPLGFIDAATAGSGGISLSGWTLDPDTADPIAVHVYVNGAFAGGAVASVRRADIALAFPGYGDRHGFDLTVPGTAGATVCIYAINVPPGVNALLGGACRRV
ncbi:MAG: SpoIID/LytB domain-containing protein [Acidimicrobiales bacterium]|nr:SpoIID/LytB domain-containing protein [Acidimicrobiales bacterium]